MWCAAHEAGQRKPVPLRHRLLSIIKHCCAPVPTARRPLALHNAFCLTSQLMRICTQPHPLYCTSQSVCVCVCARAHAPVRGCVGACVRACQSDSRFVAVFVPLHARARARVYVRTHTHAHTHTHTLSLCMCFLVCWCWCVRLEQGLLNFQIFSDRSRFLVIVPGFCRLFPVFSDRSRFLVVVPGL